jgi:hypothetical protein
VGDERAETYLRRVAEAELRRAGHELRRLDAEPGTGTPGAPIMEAFAVASRAQWKVVRTGRILVAAGALDRDFLHRLASEFHVAVNLRSRFLLSWDRQRGVLVPSMAEPPPPPPPTPPAPAAMVATPIGRMLRVSSDRAPSALHVLSLVRTETEAVLALAMRMHWPPDGSSADLEASGAGPQHLPYDRLSVMDEQGTRYAIRFESGGPGGGTVWRGIARLEPVPLSTVRRLDLAGNGTKLVELPFTSGAEDAPPAPAAPATTGKTGISPGERLLVLEAERILATREPRAPRERPDPAEISAVLKETGVIAQDSPLPSQLAALYRRLGGDWPTRTGPPASATATAEIPAPWASVLAGYSTPRSAEVPEVFAPVAQLLPEIDGARFALAGLSITAGESHLHVIGSGHLPTPADRYEHNWTPGFSWWLEDNAGNWHVATLTEPWSFGDGLQSFLLRLTPALDSVPGRVEVVVTGPATQIRAVVPIG